MGKVFVQTFGCQMNVYDSGKIHALLGKDGYEPTESMDDADVIARTLVSRLYSYIHRTVVVAWRDGGGRNRR